MQDTLYIIAKSDLFDLFSRLAEENRVFVPYDYKDKFFFAEFDPARESSIQLGGIRQSQPFKSFINPARERIIGDEDSDKRHAPHHSLLRSSGTGHVIVAGVKACDLASIILQDFVFLKGDYEDPLYAFHRNNTTIISSDCTLAKETCFCIAMAGRPYPEKYFDLNISWLDNSFLIETGSDKGRAVINSYKTFFRTARHADLGAREKIREDVSAQVRDFIKRRGTPDTAEIKDTVKKHYDNLAMWQDHSSTCVECGACNLVCPTCHCFLLFDEKSEQKIGRSRVWDACLYKTFARVAGGANPRKHLYERLRNRFDKKFAFFPEVLDHTACTGCGRCIEACPGDIDLREVLKGLVSGKWNKPPHD